ncbi:metallophosphoesterase [Pedobacter sp. Hv1]|nr:metallophosphoesterase [Pedobacter sp. Hv1]
MFWVEKFFIEINEFFFDKATKETENIKLVQLSDLHLQSLNYQLRRLTAQLNKMQPELILITGDAIDKAEHVPLLNEFLKLIDKNIQKVAILGNWEYWGSIDLNELKKVYENNNCTLLVNQTVSYAFRNRTISITGVDDFIGGKPDFTAAIKEYRESDYHIILNHCPQYSEQISAQLANNMKVDFILSGHTHGGQFNFFGFIPFLPQGSGKYVKGWYNDNIPKLYVSKGIGTSIFPARFGARAEIAIFNLERG